MGWKSGMGPHELFGGNTKKLIRAVVAVLDGIKDDEGEYVTASNGEKMHGPPPHELVLAWRCKEWSTMPRAGGYYDQDYGLMKRMSYVKNVYNALSSFRNMKGKEIHKMSIEQRKIIGLLRSLKFI